MTAHATAGAAAAGLHVLVLARDFPPVDSPVARRAMAIANALAQAGEAVTVLSIDSPATRSDHGVVRALEDGIDPRVRVVHVVDDHPDLAQDIARWPRDRAADPAGWRVQWLQEAASAFDEPGAGHLLGPVTAAAGTIHADRPVDLVVAVAAPLVLAVAGAELSATWDSALVIDLARVSDGDLAVESDRVAAALDRASVVCVPDETTRARVGGLPAERVLTVPDGGEVAAVPSEDARVPSGPVTRIDCFVEADAWDSFVEVLEGWFRTRQDVAELADAAFTVHGRFPFAGSGAVRLAAAQAAERGVLMDTPPTREALDVAGGADLLVVVSNGSLPAGRTFDHLAAGRPIAWCTAQEPSPGHPYERAPHVVRARSLAPEDIRTAILDASRLDPGPTDADPPRSSWPEAVPVLAALRAGGSAR